jgi:hypothetical protein
MIRSVAKTKFQGDLALWDANRDETLSGPPRNTTEIRSEYESRARSLSCGGRHGARECRGLDVGEHSRFPCGDRHAACALPAPLHPLKRRAATRRMTLTGSLPIRPAPTSTPVASGASTSPRPAAAQRLPCARTCAPQLGSAFSFGSLAPCRSAVVDC